ncbi:PREDICTED: alpha-1,6-mannosylglycoprotein 6-beta-N-acetylglucosaminyltransferase B-like [Cyprinodon variegatus]|uniref:alpha-1,6-mannosylglycoprotein 6-beta-N-acetylglucosaminyltransferase B-like n=1 Tax=Cyprinodon variegatus TaxID=28743 RepID=UPI000742C2F9|nr:PREDICTED: alpha-1,6-mannosylglycoprotein 6-beta-N-acetylglucosaminyltransferase B-like [Cyprinodon variegatus]
MTISVGELSMMVRRCPVTFKPFRIFVVGVGFFSLCFLMTSLGSQFSAKRPGDSPFTTRAEVLSGQESRGVLRKISDMLEMIMKRMDAMSKLGNTTNTHRLDELSSALDRFQPMGLVDRIQAIAQNMSDMAVRVEQILQRSMANSRGKDGVFGSCETPKDPHYPDCTSKMDWMRARWTSDPCYAFYGVDGSDCSFLIYLSEVEWFCPPLPWRNQTATPTLKPLPKKQAVFQSDIGSLLEQVGTGKESLSFMKRRIRRLSAEWASAARRLDEKLRSHQREQKRILVHVGFLTEESGDVFSPKVLKGGPLGEMVQWADILTALHVLGHDVKISVSLKELHGSQISFWAYEACSTAAAYEVRPACQMLRSSQGRLDCNLELWKNSSSENLPACSQKPNLRIKLSEPACLFSRRETQGLDTNKSEVKPCRCLALCRSSVSGSFWFPPSDAQLEPQISESCVTRSVSVSRI